MQRLHCELPNAIREIPDCGHIPRVKRPNSIAKLIVDFVQEYFVKILHRKIEWIMTEARIN